MEQVGGECLLLVVAAATAVRPVEHVHRDADVAAAGEFIADEAAAVVAGHPFAGRGKAFGGVVPWFDDLLLADVEAGAVVVEKEDGGMRTGRFRAEHQREHAAVLSELDADLAGEVGAAVLFG